MEDCIKDCKNCYILTCDRRIEFPSQNRINNEDCSDYQKLKEEKLKLLSE